MDRVLVIGGNSGIGKAFVDRCSSISILGNVDWAFYVPTRENFEVTDRIQVYEYIRENGPFRYIVYSAGVNQLSWIKDLFRETDLDYSLPDIHFKVNAGAFMSIVSSHVNLYPKDKVSAVAISSDAATNPMRGSIAYCVSKAALDMAIKCMARELAPLWRVNGVAPGMVDGTPMTEYIDATIPYFRGWSPYYAREYERSSVPTGRRATLEEVAATILWVLTGPEQLTGQIIKINGGKS